MNLKKKPEIIQLEDVFERVGELEIFEYYIGKIEIDKAFCSPLRRDRHPSATIYKNKYGHYKYKDFASDDFSGGPIDFVCKMYNINFQEAIEKIAGDLGIANRNINREYVASFIKKEEEKEKEYSIIKPIISSFTQEDLAYWGKRLLNKADLENAYIYHFKEGWVTKNGKTKKIWRRTNELAFLYWFPNAGKDVYKVYFPNRREYRFTGNVPLGYIEELHSLKNVNKGIVTKSRKDRLILSKLGIPVCNCQNESDSSFTPEVVEFLHSNVNQVFINFDGDVAGKKASMKVTKSFNFKHLNIPNYLIKTGLTDFDDWLVECGDYKEIIKFLKKKQIL